MDIRPISLVINILTGFVVSGEEGHIDRLSSTLVIDTDRNNEYLISKLTNHIRKSIRQTLLFY